MSTGIVNTRAASSLARFSGRGQNTPPTAPSRSQEILRQCHCYSTANWTAQHDFQQHHLHTVNHLSHTDSPCSEQNMLAIPPGKLDSAGD